MSLLLIAIISNFEFMAPLGFAAYSNEMSLKKGNNYILYSRKRGWMLTDNLTAGGEVYGATGKHRPFAIQLYPDSKY